MVGAAFRQVSQGRYHDVHEFHLGLGSPTHCRTEGIREVDRVSRVKHEDPSWPLQAFSERAGAPKGTVEADDLTMAIQAHATFAFVQPPPQDVRAVYRAAACW